MLHYSADQKPQALGGGVTVSGFLRSVLRDDPFCREVLCEVVRMQVRPADVIEMAAKRSVSSWVNAVQRHIVLLLWSYTPG